jgi:hypothetical protein
MKLVSTSIIISFAIFYSVNYRDNYRIKLCTEHLNEQYKMGQSGKKNRRMTKSKFDTNAAFLCRQSIYKYLP